MTLFIAILLLNMLHAAGWWYVLAVFLWIAHWVAQGVLLASTTEK